MANPEQIVNAVRKIEFQIAIPATGNAAKIRTLLSAAVLTAIGQGAPAADQVPTSVPVLAGKLAPAGAAWLWSTLAAVPTFPMASTDTFNEPSEDFLDTYVVSAAGAIATVNGVLYLGR